MEGTRYRFRLDSFRCEEFVTAKPLRGDEYRVAGDLTRPPLREREVRSSEFVEVCEETTTTRMTRTEEHLSRDV